MWPFQSHTSQLFKAIETGDIELLRRLLAHGAPTNVRQKGRSALAHALYRGNPDAVRMLLEAKTDPNASLREGHSESALHFICRSSFDRAFFDALISFGANPNAVLSIEGSELNGMTPLLLLVSSSNAQRSEFVRVLLEGGASVHARDARGRTALMLLANSVRTELSASSVTKLKEGAALERSNHSALRAHLPFEPESDQMHTLRLLLAAKCDVTATDHLGLSALDHARLHKNEELASALRLSGSPQSEALSHLSLPLNYGMKGQKIAI